jgi:Fic family protein
MKSNYKPPFTVSARVINLIADIAAQIERYAIRMEQEDGLLLRKINRIKTIHGSLAIEGNTLSESLITDIIAGIPVVAPLREIQEVKNAILTYDVFSSLDPFSVKDLLKAHRLMMQTLVDDAGYFRKSGVGVFAGAKAVHVAPPAGNVPYLMDNLFEWLKKSDDHLLIKSCVFHYEFEFIHPFIDGNGRLGRLWQSLILSKLHHIFAHLPVENIVFQNQQQYYTAISQSTKAADCCHFIEFMLDEILTTLKKRQGEPLKGEGKNTTNEVVNGAVNGVVKIVYDFIANNEGCRKPVIAKKTKLPIKTVDRHIIRLREMDKIFFVGAPKTGGYFIKNKK